MKMSWHRCGIDGSVFFSGKVLREDIEGLTLDLVDQALLYSEATTAADMLLILEMLFRKGAEKENENSNDGRR